jgi:hypothetical protein
MNETLTRPPDKWQGLPPLSCTDLLGIVNAIFETNLTDADAIDATGLWEIIVAEMKPFDYYSETLRLRYIEKLTLRECGKRLNVTGARVRERCMQSLRRLRHPEHLRRIRGNIQGWPNLYRDA